MSRHISARPEQSYFPNSLTSIVSDALRAAAFAPTLSDALDVAGAALIDVAKIARGETRAAEDTHENAAFLLIREVADETLHVFDRLAGVLEAIERLSVDNDEAIVDLAAIARGLIAKQTDRVDLVFTYTARCVSTTGAQS